MLCKIHMPPVSVGVSIFLSQTIFAILPWGGYPKYLYWFALRAPRDCKDTEKVNTEVVKEYRGYLQISNKHDRFASAKFRA
ncbi:hypothetical protein TNCT_725811 [Trichonephila clavata]|uniref:Uncharacterized protein n=1 Tax=Trichonephila clavata TaxID=2740835 RepID=A0A8X6LIG4_TRICU|nr:hypothetical protein TNCT_725811 [Trichonephila clavata]